MKDLQARLDAIRRDVAKVQRDLDRLQAQEALILDLMRERRGESSVKLRAPRSNVKQTVLDLLARVGDDGLNAASAVELVAQGGQTIERGSVSSVLSRLKTENVVQYDGNVYRLIQRRGEGGSIHHLRTSEGAA